MANALSELWSGVTGIPSGVQSMYRSGRTQIANATGQQIPGLNTTQGQLNSQAGVIDGSALQQLHDQGDAKRQADQVAADAAALKNKQYNAAQELQSAARAQYGDPSQYDAQIQAYNGQLGGLQGQTDVGLQNNVNDYNLQGNRLRTQQGNDQQAYDQSVQQNTQSYQNNRTKTLNATRANTNALQRLLGLNGAGNSSASYEQAPYAAALQGSQDLGEAQQTYSTNGMNLGTNWKKTQDSYKNAFDDLDTQKFRSDNSVRSSVAQSRADLLDKLDTAAMNRRLASGQAAGGRDHQAEIESLLQQVTQLGKGYAQPIQAQSVQAQPLSLADYAAGRNLTAQNQGGAGAGDIQTPFLSLLAQRRDEFGNPIAA